MPFTLSPNAVFTGLDDLGAIIPGGKLCTYAAGTNTPQDTYIDSAGTPNTNPVILNAAGRAVVYLGALHYKFILKDANDVEIWTAQDVFDAAATAVAGDLVGTTDTQTLTNKTLTVPTINFGTLNSPTINTPAINNPTVDTGTFDTPSIADPIFTTKVALVKRLSLAKGANVVAASTLTLGDDGNVFAITGSTTINHITTTNWQAGSPLILIFTAAIAITHNAGTVPANAAPILLSGGVDLGNGSGGAMVLFLIFDGDNWQEVAMPSANHA